LTLIINIIIRLFIAEQELEKEAQRREEVEQKLKRFETLEKGITITIFYSLIYIITMKHR
jgi:hypothetical protein